MDLLNLNLYKGNITIISRQTKSNAYSMKKKYLLKKIKHLINQMLKDLLIFIKKLR